ncbi:hypothetical protein [Allisonella histaminiformans]|uniref:hypothetical protein n=1 Tax=Allisonella histaminiformans TaxID=209880 RepID=UPI002E7789A6|nr:hypothetical protein [Allisonella histaminiformans]
MRQAKELTNARKIISMIKAGEGITSASIADIMGYTPQNFNDKLSRNTLRLDEIIKIIHHYGYSIEISKSGMTLKL